MTQSLFVTASPSHRVRRPEAVPRRWAAPTSEMLEITFCVRGVISPLLANVFLHYVFDLWVRDWRRQATGDVIVVRYADDFIVGFQYEHEASGLPPPVA